MTKRRLTALTLTLLMLLTLLPVSAAPSPEVFFEVKSIVLAADGKTLTVTFSMPLNTSTIRHNMCEAYVDVGAADGPLCGTIKVVPSSTNKRVLVMTLDKAIVQQPYHDAFLLRFKDGALRSTSGLSIADYANGCYTKSGAHFKNTSQVTPAKIVSAVTDDSGNYLIMTCDRPIDITTIREHIVWILGSGYNPIDGVGNPELNSWLGSNVGPATYASADKKSVKMKLDRRLEPHTLAYIHYGWCYIRALDTTQLAFCYDQMVPITVKSRDPFRVDWVSIKQEGRSVDVCFNRHMDFRTIKLSDLKLTSKNGSDPIWGYTITAIKQDAKHTILTLTLDSTVETGCQNLTLTADTRRWKAWDGIAITDPGIKTFPAGKSTNISALTLKSWELTNYPSPGVRLEFYQQIDPKSLNGDAIKLVVTSGPYAGKVLSCKDVTSTDSYPSSGVYSTVNAILAQPLLAGQTLKLVIEDRSLMSKEGAAIHKTESKDLLTYTKPGLQVEDAYIIEEGNKLRLKFNETPRYGHQTADFTITGTDRPVAIVKREEVQEGWDWFTELTLSAPILAGDTGITISHNPYKGALCVTDYVATSWSNVPVRNESTLATDPAVVRINGVAATATRSGKQLTITPSDWDWYLIKPTLAPSNSGIEGFSANHTPVTITANDSGVRRFVLNLTAAQAADLNGALLSFHAGGYLGAFAPAPTLFTGLTKPVVIDFDTTTAQKVTLNITHNNKAMALQKAGIFSQIAIPSSGVKSQPNGSTAAVKFNTTILPRSWQLSNSTLAQVSACGSYTVVVKTPHTYSDMLSWAAPHVSLLDVRGVVGGIGNGKFAPSRPVTRAEFAALLVRMVDKSVNTGSTKQFTDGAGGWYSDTLLKARKLGITGGYPDGSFKPNAPITRQDMSVMLYRAMQKFDYQPAYSAADKRIERYYDWHQVSDYARESVNALFQNKILLGNDYRLQPKSATTRAEAATVTARLISHDSKRVRGE